MVYMFLANGFEEIEALCPLDLLRRAGVGVTTVAIGAPDRHVTGAHGITVLADDCECAFDGHDIEAIILPGGMPGAANLDASPTVERAIAQACEQGAILSAICAAPMILGKRGLLAGKRATCFPGFEEHLIGATLDGARVVTDGKIITAAGMGVALDFGLSLVAALTDADTAAALRRGVLAD